MIKRFICLLLVASMALPLIGCGEKKDETVANPEAGKAVPNPNENKGGGVPVPGIKEDGKS